MKTLLLLLSLTLPAFAQDAPIIGHCDKQIGQAVTLTLTNGQQRSGKIAGVDAIGLDLFTSDGGCHVDFTSLTPADQSKFGYNPARAKAQEQAELDAKNREAEESAEYARRAALKAAKPKSNPTSVQPTIDTLVEWKSIKAGSSIFAAEQAVEAQKQFDLTQIAKFQSMEMISAKTDADRQNIATKYYQMANQINEQAFLNARLISLKQDNVPKGYQRL